MKYTILEGDTASDLMVVVQGAIGNGWTPLGGVCVTPKVHLNNVFKFYQAMTKGT